MALLAYKWQVKYDISILIFRYYEAIYKLAGKKNAKETFKRVDLPQMFYLNVNLLRHADDTEKNLESKYLTGSSK